MAPYFIDAEAGRRGECWRHRLVTVATSRGRWRRRRRPLAPVGGLTVIAFRNTHLTYADDLVRPGAAGGRGRPGS